MGSSFPPLPKKLEEGCCGPDRPPVVSVDRHHLRATAQLTGLPTVGMAGNAGVGCSGPRLPFMSLTPGSGWLIQGWAHQPGWVNQMLLPALFKHTLEGLQPGLLGLNHGSCSAPEKRSETLELLHSGPS